MISGTWKDSEFREGMRGLARAMGAPMSEIVRDEARLFFREVLRVIPPKTQAQGRKAVKRDLTRAIELLRVKDWASPQMKKAIRGRKYQAIRDRFKFIKKRENWRVEKFDRSFHENARGSRGRVHSNKKIATPDSKPWNAYLRELYGRVGYLKGQFAFPLSNLRGKVPGWLRRHFPSLTGRFKNHLRKIGNPHVKMMIDLFDFGRFKSAINFALNRRIRSMQRKAERELENGWKRGR